MDPYRHFPGDPPVPDTLLLLAALVAVALVVLCAVLWLLGRWRQLALLAAAGRGLAWALIFPGLVALGSILFISQRHFGAWSELKQELRKKNMQFSAFLIDHPHLEMWEAAQQFERESGGPWEFQFTPGEKPVYIHMMRMVPPNFAGVDFGNGGNAVFATGSMIVVYAD